MQKTPRSEVSASLRDLNSGSNRLPWTRVILSVTSASVQRAVGSGPGVVCSRAANGGIGRGVLVRTIAATRAGARPDAGGAGGPASATGPARWAKNAGVSRVGAIGSAAASGQRRQLTRSGWTRASALRRRLRIFRGGRAIDRAVTNYSPLPMNISASVFAAWRADWPYGACWIGRAACASVVAGSGAGG